MGSLQQEKMEESRGAQTRAEGGVRRWAFCRAVEHAMAVDYINIIIITIMFLGVDTRFLLGRGTCC